MSDSEARTRADLVRQRRKQEAGKRLNQSAVLATRPVSTPITSRTALSPVAPRAGRRASHRRSEMSISMPGVEVRMPTISFSGPQAKWRFLSFAVALMLGAGLYMAGTAPAFRAAPAQVRGNQRIAPEEIDAVLGSAGAQIFALVPRELEKRLRVTFPDLLDARVTIGLPNQVLVDVRERTPVLAWHQDGGYTWIDESGIAFRPRGVVEGLITVQAQNAPKPVTAAVSDPLTPTPFVPADLITAIKTLAPHAPAGAAIIYDARYGLGWTDSRGWQVYFGEQPRDMELRLRVYESMVNMLGEKGIRPAFISVQYPSSPYYRMTP